MNTLLIIDALDIPIQKATKDQDHELLHLQNQTTVEGQPLSYATDAEGIVQMHQVYTDLLSGLIMPEEANDLDILVKIKDILKQKEEF